MEKLTIKVAPKFFSLNIVIVLSYRIYFFILFKHHIFFCALIILHLTDFFNFVTKVQVRISTRDGFILLKYGDKDGLFLRLWHPRQLKIIIWRTQQIFRSIFIYFHHRFETIFVFKNVSWFISFFTSFKCVTFTHQTNSKVQKEKYIEAWWSHTQSFNIILIKIIRYSKLILKISLAAAILLISNTIHQFKLQSQQDLLRKLLCCLLMQCKY